MCVCDCVLCVYIYIIIHVHIAYIYTYIYICTYFGMHCISTIVIYIYICIILVDICKLVSWIYAHVRMVWGHVLIHDIMWLQSHEQSAACWNNETYETCSEVAATTSWLSLSIFGDGHRSQRCQVGQGLRTSSYIFEMSVMMEELLFNYSHCEMLSIISMVC